MAVAEYDHVLVIDFGSQYTQLIARRIRERGVYAEILPCTAKLDDIKAHNPVALILSGGPASVYDDDAPKADPALLELGVPILGICYGQQWLALEMGGEVKGAHAAEYGRRVVNVLDQHGPLFENVPTETTTWMSHGDQIERLPDGFSLIGKSDTCPVAAMADEERKIYGLQFHPEVRHSVDGSTILENFLFKIVGANTGWSMAAFEEEEIRKIREQVGDGYVIGGVSGGVDSTVMAALLHRAIGEKFLGVFVDNGLLRKDEVAQVYDILHTQLGVNLHVVDASDRFLTALSGVTDPEKKRKIIGHTFIDVFDEEATRHSEAQWLAQGTLYPDVIESVSFKGPSVTIKSHHNVGGLPETMKLKLIEPLRELFKDEVRELGARLGIPAHIVNRHPFPGPGLAVRILGEVTSERLKVLREADAIFIEELRNSGWYDKVSQALAVLLPVKSVGVMGDARTYADVIALRSVNTWDFMTADFSPLPHDLLGTVSTRIINEVRGVNRVVYDVSSKPPATVEWE
ncbi:glutamine-hydrolyzing GMP synthase [bacterium]|nr:glutamine-hydrolyzing GMP synthase [bacterium]